MQRLHEPLYFKLISPVRASGARSATVRLPSIMISTRRAASGTAPLREPTSATPLAVLA